jgi:PhnB protein
MLNINAYLHFMGKTEEAMNFYKLILGGEFTIFGRFRDVPGGENMKPEDQKKVMHISLTTKNGTVIMATDSLESMGQQVNFGNNVHLCIQAESEAEVDKLFAALSAGGKVEMPVNKTFWGAYFGMCQDKFGVQWMINYTYNQN